MKRGLDLIDKVSKSLEVIGVLFVPLSIIVLYEVVARYIFHSPTIWVWDVSQLMMGFIVFFSGAYCLFTNSHVNVDVFQRMMKGRTLTRVNLGTFLVFLVSFVLLLKESITQAQSSVASSETMYTVLRPPVYPLKILMVIAVFLFLVQGIAIYTRMMIRARHSQDEASGKATGT